MRDEGLCLHLQSSSFVLLQHTLPDDLHGVLCVCPVFILYLVCSVLIHLLALCVCSVCIVIMSALVSHHLSKKKNLFKLKKKSFSIKKFTLYHVKSVLLLLISYYQCDQFTNWKIIL